MADINKRSPGCDDDCEGERGKRGKRGHRGHRGPTGPAAPTSDAITCSRRRITIQPLTCVLVDTFINSPNEVMGAPPLGTIPPQFDLPPFSGQFTDSTGIVETTLLTPVPGTLPASRLQVIPEPPISNWSNISMPTEPFWNPVTGTVWVTLCNTNQLLPVEINVFFLDPLISGKCKVDTYSSQDNPNPDSGPF
jgi:hypothetical protein